MSSPASVSLSELSVTAFAPHVGESFAVSLEMGGTQVATFTLEEAIELGENPHGRKPFSLIFEGPPEIELQQQILWLSNPGIGTAAIFVVPINGDSQKRRYQAIFN